MLRIILVIITGIVLVCYKSETSYEYFVTENLHYVIPIFAVSLALTKAFLMVEELEIKKKTKKQKKIEFKIFEQKKKILKDMDENFKGEIKEILMKMIGKMK